MSKLQDMCASVHVTRHEVQFLQELIRQGPPLYSGKGKFALKNGGTYAVESFPTEASWHQLRLYCVQYLTWSRWTRSQVVRDEVRLTGGAQHLEPAQSLTQ